MNSVLTEPGKQYPLNTGENYKAYLCVHYSAFDNHGIDNVYTLRRYFLCGKKYFLDWQCEQFIDFLR
jgi:hypothetical protein